MITWTYYEPPYLGGTQEIFDNMLAGYAAGAKYVIVFNYLKCPETDTYGILNEDYFATMKNFYYNIRACPRNAYGRFKGHVAMVLPENFGWGARRQDDIIWGLWPADEKAILIWENINKLIMKCGFELGIIFDDARFPYRQVHGDLLLEHHNILILISGPAYKIP
jgi:hypothetical protein